MELFEYYTFICFLISISVICINEASFAKRCCSASYNSHIAQNANSHSRGMQLRCKCVRGRVPEKLHELQCVRRMNSGWNEEKLMASDRRRGCHSLFFSVSVIGTTEGARNARLDRIDCSYSDDIKIFYRRASWDRTIQRFAHKEKRNCIECVFPSRYRAFNFTLFERNWTDYWDYHMIKF